MELVRFISVLLIIIGILLALIVNFIAKFINRNKPIKRDMNHDFCILIPARYESKVIGNLLKSIKKQSFKINMKDVYVIVESMEDETVNICKKYNATVFLRKKLNLQRKGYALDEAVQDILSKNKHYDAYFIFDADNVLDKDFIKNMLPVYDKGYDLACGYRNCKNGNDSVVAASSALTFSLINTVFNNSKTKETRNITFSGTGFYIRGSILEELGGYPFHELTEDYEISMYATLNNLTTCYNTKSEFFDEQPLKYKQTINQRERWIRGYFDVRKKYTRKIFRGLKLKDKNFGSKLDESFGVVYYVFMVVGIVFWMLSLLVNIIINLFSGKTIIWLLFEYLMIILAVYLALLVMTFVIILLERKKIKLDTSMKIKVLFYNPLFMMTYVPCAIRALCKKEIKWQRVEHNSN